MASGHTEGQRSGGSLDALRHHTRLYRRLLGAQARSQGAYRTSFLLDSLGTLLITAAESAALALILPRLGSLSGWTLGDTDSD
ncbi:hypothetical protein [Deinococcus sp.]|uniref:hypothetical protein n=1 Tax=Deinococcus sp. TaxID=47478 RepID=UPI0025C2A63F|nr:hypothetical protein [Deinococcus sp.]